MEAQQIIRVGEHIQETGRDGKEKWKGREGEEDGIEAEMETEGGGGGREECSRGGAPGRGYFVGGLAAWYGKTKFCRCIARA